MHTAHTVSLLFCFYYHVQFDFWQAQCTTPCLASPCFGSFLSPCHSGWLPLSLQFRSVSLLPSFLVGSYRTRVTQICSAFVKCPLNKWKSRTQAPHHPPRQLKHYGRGKAVWVIKWLSLCFVYSLASVYFPISHYLPCCHTSVTDTKVVHWPLHELYYTYTSTHIHEWLQKQITLVHAHTEKI